MDNVYTVVITALTVLGGTSAWRYYEKRAMNKEKHEEFARVDCRERISKLEALLEESSNEKNELRQLILQLTSQVAELRVKVEFITAENERLEKTVSKKSRGTQQ
jgi:hypothetical protein